MSAPESPFGFDQSSVELPETVELEDRHHDDVEVLLQALPYIQKFRGAVVVVKFGGSAMSSPERYRQFAEDIVLMHQVGMKPVVVHGGGPQIGEWLKKLGKTSEFRDGRRVTDAETLEIAQMVLVGKVNSELVASLNRHAPIAVGLAGTDAALLTVEQAEGDLGFVGSVTEVNTELLDRLLAMELVPVLSTVGADADGQAYNINADDVASAVAAALQSEKLIFLTDVPGVLSDPSDESTVITHMTTGQARGYIADGTIGGGMIPKVEGCIDAIERGVGSVHMVDGRVPHVLLLELFTDAGVGSMIEESDQ